MELLQKYIKEIEADLKIDEFNIKEVQMRTPSRKHFWTSRMINHKVELEKLKNDKLRLKKVLVTEFSTKNDMRLSLPAIEKAAENVKEMQDLSNKIKEVEFIIELLEKTEKTLSSLSFDLSNCIKIMALEQT